MKALDEYGVQSCNDILEQCHQEKTQSKNWYPDSRDLTINEFHLLDLAPFWRTRRTQACCASQQQCHNLFGYVGPRRHNGH